MEGTLFKERDAFMVEAKKQKAIKSTMAYKILKAHNKGDDENLKIKFDALASHDITYVGKFRLQRLPASKNFPFHIPSQTATTRCARLAAPSTKTTTSSAFPPQKNTAATTFPRTLR